MFYKVFGGLGFKQLQKTRVYTVFGRLGFKKLSFYIVFGGLGFKNNAVFIRCSEALSSNT